MYKRYINLRFTYFTSITEDTKLMNWMNSRSGCVTMTTINIVVAITTIIITDLRSLRGIKMTCHDVKII